MLTRVFSTGLNPIYMTLILSGIAYLGNVASLPLFYGIDFIFGSIAVMYAVMMLRPVSVVVVALVGGLYTLQLWGHPYAMIIFTMEALWVSWFWHKGYKRLAIVDAAYWLVLGIPLVLLMYSQFIGVNITASVFIGLKQSLNGIFNALVAHQIYIAVQVVWKRNQTISVKPLLFNVILLITLITGSIPAIISGNQAKDLYESQLHAELEQNMANIKKVLSAQQQRDLNFQKILEAMPETDYSGIALIKDNQIVYKAGAIKSITEDSASQQHRQYEIFTWLPATDAAVMKRWEQGRYVVIEQLKDHPGIDAVVIEKITTKVVDQVNEAKTELFLILAGLTALGFLLAELASYWVTKPVERLTEASRGIISNITSGENVSLPESYIQEFQHLSQTISSISSNLSVHYKDLSNAKNNLEGIVNENTATLKRLSMVASRTNNGVVITNIDGEVEWTNAAFERLTGYQLNEVVGKRPGDILQGEDTDLQTVYRISNSINNYESFSEDIINYNRKGEPYWVHIDCDPIVENGETIGFIAIEADITQRKKVEEALRKRTGELNAVLNAATEISVITTDTQGTIMMFNSGAEKMLGYSADEMINKQTPAVIHLESEVIARGQELTDILGGDVSGFRVFVTMPEINGSETREWTYVRKDGSHITVLLSVTAVKSSDGKTTGYLGVAQDITERKQLENMKSEFVSTVSHELRTPLTSIKGTLGLINGGAVGEVPENMKSIIEVASSNTERLTLLINDLLDMEKIASGNMTFDIKKYNLLDLVDESIKLNQSYADRYHVQYNFVPKCDSAIVFVDKDRVLQVLANYLSNAAKFSHKDGNVDISIDKNDSAVRVAIRDYGIGIDKEFFKHMFSKFSQADGSDTRSKGGTGLGLAISKELIEKMHGQVGFTTEKDQGSVFWFEIPLSQVSNEDQEITGNNRSQSTVV